jgi:hypothetical protein
MKSDILIVDNFLPEETFQTIKTRVMGQNSPWYYDDGVDFHDDREESDITKFQFIYVFYENCGWNCGDFSFLLPLLEKINPLSILRMKANLQPRSDVKSLNSFHTDLSDHWANPEHVTAVYYLNTCDGETVFQSGERTKSVANRIVFFPGNKAHTGTTVTNAKTRCVININFIQKVTSKWIET